MMVKTIKSMNNSFMNQLNSIATSKKVYSVLFNAAAMICVAVAAIVGANAISMWAWERAGIGEAAAAASILIIALGKWRQTVLMKRETSVKKHKEITDHMIMGAQLIMEEIGRIYYAARMLEMETESLSEVIDDEEKVAAVGRRFKELVRNVENYNSIMKWVKEDVLNIIAKALG